MDTNINVLDELNKGCCMGVDAIDIIIKKVDEFKFKELLENQKNGYEELCNKIDELYREYSNDNIHETNMMEKAMTWYGIQKDTFLDDSTSKLADLLINGTNMGIIEGRKLLNNKIMDKKVKKICEEYIKFQERYLEKLIIIIERSRIRDYMYLTDSKRRLFIINLIEGLGKGFGQAIGFTILAAIVLGILFSWVDLPFIGRYIAKLLNYVQEYSRQVR